MESEVFKKQFEETYDIEGANYILGDFEEDLSKFIDSESFYKNSLMLMEESSELIQAISKINRYRYDKNDDLQYGLIEEMADVIICIDLICLELGVSRGDIDRAIKVKMKYNVERLNKSKKPKNETVSRIEKEIKLAKEVSDEYGSNCLDSAKKAYMSLLDDGHSGYSISFTKNILNRMIDSLPLTPIEDNEDTWASDYSTRYDGTRVYYCKRMSGLFKVIHPDGTVSFRDINRSYYIDIAHEDSTWSSKWVRNLVDKLYPIAMPYYPDSRKYKVRAETYGKRIGEYDIYHIIDLQLPDGTVILIDKYFKEHDDPKDIEITKEEFEKLKESRV